MRVKLTVTTTHGTDPHAQVVLIPRTDHHTMLKLYFALKVWVMADRFLLIRAGPVRTTLQAGPTPERPPGKQ